MGKVYKISYPITGKIGAMKLLAPHPFLENLLGYDAIEALFTREAVTMARIRHPHIAEILDFDWFGGRPYYIMDYYCNNLGTMIGESYETEKPSRMIPLDKALEYTRQVLSGLSCLHFFSLIHRDIKPFNILVTDQDQVKICDFGLSKLRKESLVQHKGLKVGSPYYAPPEQERDPDSVDFSSDLYAVGVMLYRMVTGRLPEPPHLAPSRFNSDLDAAWDRFILKSCDPEPRHRYPDADSMLRDLEELKDRWMHRKKQICSAPSWLLEDDAPVPGPGRIRDKGAKVGKREAKEVFGADDLMRPAQYTVNHFQVLSDDAVKDGATGLVWQTSGTRFPVTMNQANEYICELNRNRHGGIASWRLPTINELFTLLNPPPKGQGYCLASVFEGTQKWIWSCDRCTYITAWYVNLELGFAGYNDLTGFYHVKAVSSGN